MLESFFTILHLIAGDLRLPPATREQLVTATERYVPEPVLATASLDAPSSEHRRTTAVPTPAPLPAREKGSNAFAAKAARALVMDADTAEILYEKNADEKAPMASIAKLMVALEALDRATSLDEVLTVPKDISKLDPASSVAGFKVGEKVTVRQLMTALLIASANDAAVTLSTGLAGSEKKFVAAMNDRAAAMGLTSTHFANSTGLDAKGNESTARDLAFLLLAAARNPLISNLTTSGATTVYTESGSSYYVKPTDQLLGTTAFTINAAKTGTTDKAGLSFVISGERDGRNVIAVLLDSPDRFSEAEQALEFAFDAFRWPTTAGADGTDATEPTRFGG